MALSLKIKPRWLRAMAAIAASAPLSLAAWVGLGFLLPGLAMEVAYGSWEDHPIGSGLVLVLAMLALSPLFLVLLWSLAVRMYKGLTPARVATRLPDEPAP